MTTPKIHLVLTDDWELRGDGSGNMRSLQFETLRQLCAIYEEFGLRGTVNAEVMQQLCHLREGQRYPKLAALADEWVQVLGSTLQRGHDVQLHIHPQWSQARYDGRRWFVEGDWSITRYGPQETRDIVSHCKTYLEDTLRAFQPQYRCLSFRGGAWSLAPSPHLLDILSDLGIEVDVSICPGLKYEHPVQLDYTQVERDLRPFYPCMQDARRVASTPQKLICVPVHSFPSHPLPMIFRRMLGRVGIIPREAAYPPDCAVPRDAGLASGSYAPWKPRGVFAMTKKLLMIGTRISDVSHLDLCQFRYVLSDIRRMARSNGCAIVPAVLASHTKNIGYFAPIRKMCEIIASSSDIEVVTMADICQNLREGLYSVRTKN